MSTEENAGARAQMLESVAIALVSFRTRQGWDINDVADRAQIDAERLASAEAGEVALDEAELQRIADVYRIAVSAFFGGRTTPIEYFFGA